MVIEEAILSAVNAGSSPSTLRLWNNLTSLVLGVGADVEKEVNVEACARLKVPIVRRFTGGGTVYNDLGNLNWSFFVKHVRNQVWKEGVIDVYRKLSSHILQSLYTMGVQATFRPPNALFQGSLKLSGMAMYIKQYAILCHGTLLVDADLVKLRLLLKRLKDPVENLNNLPGVKISMSQMKNAIFDNVGRAGGNLVVSDTLNSVEEGLLINASPERYRVMASAWRLSSEI